MPYTVPNDDDVSYDDQAEPDAMDFRVLGDDRYGVISGCAVSAQGVANMSVAVASGIVVVNEAVVSVSSTTVSIGTAGATARFDLVVVNSGGTVSVLPGTGSTNPVFPDATNYTVLAAVYVPVGASSITNSLITDKRKQSARTVKRAIAATTDVFLSVRTDAATLVRFAVYGDGKMIWRPTQGTQVTLQPSSTGFIGPNLNLPDARITAKNLQVSYANPDPNSNVTGQLGDLYIAVVGTASLWFKATGDNTNTGWVQIV